MEKKQKKIIKSAVREGLSSILVTLKIAKPSAKMVNSLNKHSKKLVSQLKAEIKKKGRKKSTVASKKRKVIKPAPKRKS